MSNAIRPSRPGSENRRELTVESHLSATVVRNASVDTDAQIVFGSILDATRRGLSISERKELAAERIRQFQTDRQQEAADPNHRPRPRDQGDRLRELLQNAIASPWATAAEAAIFQHVLDVLNGEA
jgi:hypothetical protein